MSYQQEVVRGPHAGRTAGSTPDEAASPGKLRMAFLGTYPPSRCGIGTFTHDLSDAVIAADAGMRATVLAMTDDAFTSEHPERVRFQIRRDVRGDYARAAEFVNYSDIRVMSIQHEYGIFGGTDGAFVLDFIGGLRIPCIATLHTVLDRPSRTQRAIVREMAGRCARIVVMSQLAVELLETSYAVPRQKVRVIPHGIPDMRNDERDLRKAELGLTDRRVLLTFGLLSPSKGIEVVIRALPKLVDRFPDVTYVVVGVTHPEIKRRVGEVYRESLEREADSLGVRDLVVFRNEFVETPELCRYLQASDVYITPYLHEAQITSGTLAYATGSGAAPVSSPYWYAKELLADGRGRLFDFGDADGLSAVLGTLLGNPQELARTQRAAYAYSRRMLWTQVGTDYTELTRDVLREDALPQTHGTCRGSLPELRLEHLVRMTDDTGLLQHAAHTVPDRRFGYCVDDNARALIVTLLAQGAADERETARLITIYLSYLYHSQDEEGRFRNFMDFRRNLDRVPGSEDCIGRALWALGLAVRLAPDEGHRLLAKRMFDKAMTLPLAYGPRGTALGLLGLDAYLQHEPDNDLAARTFAALGANLTRRFDEAADVEWGWFEAELTYENALLPLALFTFAMRTGDGRALLAARRSLSFLESLCFSDEHLQLIGNAGWYVRGGDRVVSDEQPIDASAFVLAFRAAYAATGDRAYLVRMRESFDWFLGANRLGLALYDATTGGCQDGLGEAEVNRNQGAESVVAFLLALLAMLDLANDGVDWNDLEMPLERTDPAPVEVFAGPSERARHANEQHAHD